MHSPLPRTPIRRHSGTRSSSAWRGEPTTRRIVLTGGPGGGKSTAAAFLAREFPDQLWVMPEAATLLYQGGVPRGSSAQGIRVAQRCIYMVQRSLEHAHALEHPGRLQLCDRGALDGAAYWPDGPQGFLSALGTSRERELARYDGVIFLRTAADLPGGYERDTAVRTEGIAAALDLDARVLALYEDHPRLVVIPSEESFLTKLGHVAEAVREMLDALAQTPAPAASGSLSGRGTPARMG